MMKIFNKIMVNKIYFLIMGFLFSSGLFAATIHVNSSTGDDASGNGSSGSPYKTFHKAYTASSNSDVINLTGTFNWNDSDETGDVAGSGYTISKNITITGQGASSTIIQAHGTYNSADRSVFKISGTVTINNVTIRHGVTTSGSSAGGIDLTGTLTIDRSVISYNRYNSSDYYGAGGIFTDQNSTLTMDDVTIDNNVFDGKYWGSGGLYSTQSVTITINNSTFSNNTTTSTHPTTYTYSYAQPSGALGVYRFCSVKITNSTIRGNTTNSYGGAIQVWYPTRFIITNCTIANNNADAGAGGINFESVTSGYKIYLKNTILANNTGNSASNDFYSDSGSSSSLYISDGGYNIVESSTNYTFSGTGDVTGDQSNLWGTGVSATPSLGDNSTSNSTQTLALTSGSVAIDAGNGTANDDVSIPATDQRGVSRSGATDIGAYEYVADETNPTVSSLSPADGAEGVATTANLVITFDEAVDVESGNITIKLDSDDSTVEAIDVTSGQVTGTGTTTITIDPTADLAEQTSYYVHIDATAFDDASSNTYAGITDKTSWNFTSADETAPTVTFSPTDGATDVTLASNITLTFSEAVRNTDDSALTDTNVDALITLKETDASGSDIAFDATIDSDKKVITVDPTGNFSNSQVVYAAIGATVEDDVNNAITASGATFTAIANRAPVLTDIDNQSTNEDTAKELTLSASDADGNSLTYSASSADASITPTVSGTTLTLTPAADWNGTVDITVAVSDGSLTDSDPFVLAVNAINDAPTDCPITSETVAENSAVGTVVGIISAVDPDAGDTFTFSLVEGDGTNDADNGLFTISGDTLKTAVILDYEEKGSCTIRMRARDSGGLDFDHSHEVTVTDVNDAPALTTIGDRSTNEDVSHHVVLSATDADGDAITYSASSAEENVTATVSNDTLHLVPAADWNGSASITATATDANSASVSTMFTLTVTAVNDAPVAVELNYPTDGIVIGLQGVHVSHDSIGFDWTASSDIEGDAISYWLVSRHFVEGRSDTLFHDTTLTDTVFSVPLKRFIKDQAELLSKLTVLRWNIIPHDDEDGPRSHNGPFHLKLDGDLLAVGGEEPIPTQFSLHQNYPNPFNPTTTMLYDLPEAAMVHLVIYDVLGRQVRTLVNQDLTAGYHRAVWDATDDMGRPLSGGLYIYRIQAGGFSKTMKMVLLK